MPATRDSNQRLNRRLIREHGYTEDGKSVFHSELGKKSAKTHESYFAKLKRENPEKLREISQRAIRRRLQLRQMREGLNAAEGD